MKSNSHFQVRFFFSLMVAALFLGNNQMQAQCTTCDVTNPPSGSDINLSIINNRTYCITSDQIYNDLISDGTNTGTGGKICVAEDVTLIIQNNVNLNALDSISFEVYGTLRFSNPNIASRIGIKVHANGVFSSSNITLNGVNDAIKIEAGGRMTIDVLNFGNDGYSLFDNLGTLNILQNMNASTSQVVFRNQGVLNLIGNFSNNSKSLFINCGELTSQSGFNLGGGKVINTGTFTSTGGQIDVGVSTSLFENYGIATISSLNQNSGTFYNEGLLIVQQWQGDGPVRGPAAGSGKKGFIEFDSDNRFDFNSKPFGPNLDITFVQGTTTNGDGRPTPKPGAGQNNTNVSSNRQWVFQNINDNMVDTTVTFACRNLSSCSTLLVTTHPCAGPDGTFPDTCPEYEATTSGLWSDTAIWRNRATPSDPWVTPALTPPIKGSSVLINYDVVMNTDFTINDCPLTLSGAASKLTIAPDKTLMFEGGTDGNAYFNHRPVIVQSTIDGTGAIGSMLANSKTFDDDNITIERFIPGSKRRWNLLAFGVTSQTATIRDAWAGGSRARVGNSTNSNAGLPLGNPPTPKPNNLPFPTPVDYVAGDGTIITGHRHANASTANGQGYDWWPELIIPAGSIFWTDPTHSVKAGALQTTPASIRPYWPKASSGGFGPERGIGWVSNDSINNGFGGGSLINQPISAAFAQQYPALMLYTRGDRQVLENWYNSTTLRPTGQINKFSVSVPILPKATQSLTVVGNVYPAPINFQSLLSANSTVIEPHFYMWDSNLPGTSGQGAWRTVYRPDPEGSPNTWSATITGALPPNDDPLTTNPQYISSSQGIMVEGTTDGGTLTFAENMKVAATDVSILPFDEISGPAHGSLYANLLNRSTNGSVTTLDGVAIILSKNLSTNLSDESDIRKVYSFTGGQSISIKHGTELLAVEGSADPETESTFPLEIIGLSQRGFRLQFVVEHLYKDGREAFLKDNFLGTLIPISTISNSWYDFEGTAEAGSLSPSRFEIVFKQTSVLPVNFTFMNAAENRGDVQVNWGVATEKNMNRYEVEHSINGRDFGKSVRVEAQNLSPANYSWTHTQPATGDHFYRVRAVDNDGKNLLTRVVKVTIGASKPGFRIFPTEVTQANDVTIQLNSIEKGEYYLQVLDMSGRTIQSQVLKHNGGSASLILQLKPSLAAGRYSIRLQGQKQNFVQPLLKN